MIPREGLDQVWVLVFRRSYRSSMLRSIKSIKDREIWIPRYPILLALTRGSMACTTVRGPVSNGRILDLVQLICKSKNIPNCLIICKVVWSEGPVSLRYKSASSMCRLMTLVTCPDRRHLMSGCALIAMAKAYSRGGYRTALACTTRERGTLRTYCWLGSGQWEPGIKVGANLIHFGQSQTCGDIPKDSSIPLSQMPW